MNQMIDQKRDIYNVTRLNREVRAVLEGSFPTIWLQGEISNFACPASGHMYLSLKDVHSQVRCAMFKNKNRSLRFEPKNGMEVLVRANVGLYEGRGEFQLIIEQMEPAGEGDLQRAFEELKQKLHKEGLFEDSQKKDLPTLPKTIGVITSPTGAAIRDILSVLKRRYPSGDIIVYPVSVQGEDAAKQIQKMIQLVEKRNECDVIILSRGGGSIEDLWAFNDESLARTIVDCTIPTVSGIGHEIDFTIADFVSDQRAATPSAAAELVSPDQSHLQQRLTNQKEKLVQLNKTKIESLKSNVSFLEKRLPHPTTRLQNIAQRLDGLSIRMEHAIDRNVKGKNTQLHEQHILINKHNPLQKLRLHQERNEQIQQRLIQAISHRWQKLNSNLHTTVKTLNAVSPLATLNRGYAIVNKSDSQEIIRNATQLKPGNNISARFANGEASCTVDKIHINKNLD